MVSKDHVVLSYLGIFVLKLLEKDHGPHGGRGWVGPMFPFLSYNFIKNGIYKNYDRGKVNSYELTFFISKMFS